jgi:RimJ/RimL family protein N-acetyltransferase
MSFGHWMEIAEGSVRLRLGPIRREDAAASVSVDAGYGLQSYEVARFLGADAPTPQGEEEWWDTASRDERHLFWGVYVPAEDEWKLVGVTHLRYLGFDQRQAESGFVVFDRTHWRQRVASTAHLGRTLYAFEELDLLSITSAAAVANVGSNRALAGVGYVETGRNYGIGLVRGRPMDHIQYLLPNPAEEAWRYFWRRPDDEIPSEFHEGRRRARAALERASAGVRYL